MGPPLSDADLLDGRPAARARLARSAVHSEALLHLPALAVDATIVADAGAVRVDATLERGDHGGVQPPGLGRRQVAPRPQRMDARVPERLVGVDVADAGHDALVQEARLDRRRPAAQVGPEARRRPLGRERLGPGPQPQVLVHLARLHQPHRPEAPLVAVEQRCAVVELEDRADVGQGRIGAAGRAVMEPAGHAQVGDERATGLELEQQVLPPPADLGEALAVELHGHLARVDGGRQPAVADVGAHHATAPEPRNQAAANGLDLGQLRHRRSLERTTRAARANTRWRRQRHEVHLDKGEHGMTETTERALNRGSLIRTAGAAGAGLALGSGLFGATLARASGGVTKGDVDILIAAEIAEALAVTTYTNIINRAPFFKHLAADDQGYLRAARQEEMSHYALEKSVTGKPSPFTKFFYPHG